MTESKSTKKATPKDETQPAIFDPSPLVDRLSALEEIIAVDSKIAQPENTHAALNEELMAKVNELEAKLFELHHIIDALALQGSPDGQAERLASLEKVVIRMAHNTGTAHGLLIDNNLAPYNPTRNDMSKVKRSA